MGFDRVARPYRFLERLVFGGALQRARVARVEEYLGVDSILLLGDGDGRFLEALLAAGCGAEIVSVDASAAMLDLARRRAGEAASEVQFFNCRIEEFELPEGFRPELVSAHFFFDCFSDGELAEVTARVADWLPEGGRVVVTDFALPEGGWLRRLWGRLLIWKMVVFFRITAGISARGLPDTAASMRAAGFCCEDQRLYGKGLIRSERWRRGCP